MKRIFGQMLVGVVFLAFIFNSVGVKTVYAAEPSASIMLVTKVADTNDGSCNSDCSLHEAIAAVRPGGTITFAPNLSGKVIRLQFTLYIGKSMTIDGSALKDRITISGDKDANGTHDVQVFNINSGSASSPIELRSLIITKGIADFGGGVYSMYNKLIIADCLFSDNYATNENSFGFGGGIYSQEATLIVSDSTFSKNRADRDGGAIYHAAGEATITDSIFLENLSIDGVAGAIINDGTMIIRNTTFSSNAANRVSIGGVGGGVFNNDHLTVVGSTFSANSAELGGGGISNWGVLNVANSTFVNNQVRSATPNYGGGGIVNNVLATSLTVTNSTFSGNAAPAGGGIYNGSSQTLQYANTIIADSTLGGDCVSLGTIAVNTNNLVEDGSCSASLSGDPALGTLAANGGLTRTLALTAGSIAIDAGDDTICASDPVNNLDQRRMPRPLGAHCDLGSYEYLPSLTPVSITLFSIKEQDGWLLESAQGSKVGDDLNNEASTLSLGDDLANRQYRGMVSFSTGRDIPDNAIVTGAMLSVMRCGVAGAGDPVKMLQGFIVDIKTGAFGTSALQPSDFQATGNASFGPFSPALVAGYYNINLKSGKGLINKLADNSGLTQIRLRFKLNTNANKAPNVLKLCSGNTGVQGNRPRLIITYMLP